MWKEFIQELEADCQFQPPAQQDVISGAEEFLKLKLPDSLRTLLQETNGLYSPSIYLNIVWSIEEVLERNLWVRNNNEYAETYMTFQSLLFFADAGVDGIMFAYPVTASGVVRDNNIIAWYPTEDSRPVLAFSLKDYLQRYFVGELRL